MTRFTVVAVMLLAIAVPSFAKTHKEDYTVSCAALWPAVKDTLRNSGKYGILGIENSEMTASFVIGGTLTGKRINSVVLNAKGEACEMQVQTAYSGLVNNDERDFKKRVDASLSKLQAAQPAPPAPAKPETPTAKPDNAPAKPDSATAKPSSPNK